MSETSRDVQVEVAYPLIKGSLFVPPGRYPARKYPAADGVEDAATRYVIQLEADRVEVWFDHAPSIVPATLDVSKDVNRGSVREIA